MIAEWIEQAAAQQRGAPYLEAPYLEDGARSRTLTYAGLRRSTAAWADRLARAGIPPGARVAIRLADPLSYAAALVGILGAGRVGHPAGPWRSGRRTHPGARRGPARGGRVRLRRRPAARPRRTQATRRAGQNRGTERAGHVPRRPPRAQAGRRVPGRGHLPVHQRDHRHAQGHPAAQGSAGSRKSGAGGQAERPTGGGPAEVEFGGYATNAQAGATPFAHGTAARGCGLPRGPGAAGCGFGGDVHVPGRDT